MKESFHNSRTSDDIDIKLEPVTKLDKKNVKEITIPSCREVAMPFSFFLFAANFVQSGKLIPDV